LFFVLSFLVHDRSAFSSSLEGIEEEEEEKKDNHVMDQCVFLPHFLSPFLSPSFKEMKKKNHTFVYDSEIQRDDCGGVGAVTARWRLQQQPLRARIWFSSSTSHAYSPGILFSLSLMDFCFLVFLFYRVAPRGVIDSRPRSIDYDYQGRVGVIRDLLSGSDRGSAI
jgi:hypothetical protein